MLVKHGDRVELGCGCTGLVVTRLFPLHFIYGIRIDQRGERCGHHRHRRGERVMVPSYSIRTTLER